MKQFGARGYQSVLVTDQETHADLFTELDVPVADLSQREIVVEEEDAGPHSEFVTESVDLVDEQVQSSW